MPHIKVFRCPNCREFISTDVKSCRFCSTPIDAQAAQFGLEAQEVENKQYRRKQYARHILIGGGLFALGFVITVGTFMAAALSEQGGSFVLTYGLMIAGAGDLIYGVVGWLSELKK